MLFVGSLLSLYSGGVRPCATSRTDLLTWTTEGLPMPLNPVPSLTRPSRSGCHPRVLRTGPLNMIR